MRPPTVGDVALDFAEVHGYVAFGLARGLLGGEVEPLELALDAAAGADALEPLDLAARVAPPSRAGRELNSQVVKGCAPRRGRQPAIAPRCWPRPRKRRASLVESASTSRRTNGPLMSCLTYSSTSTPAGNWRNRRRGSCRSWMIGIVHDARREVALFNPGGDARKLRVAHESSIVSFILSSATLDGSRPSWLSSRAASVV